MMLFNPLFVQNSPADGAANLKQNKLNPNGYLFSDIINVYMGNEEGMDGQVKEFNPESVEAVVLNLEKDIPISTDGESIKSKFEQLEKYLLQFKPDAKTEEAASEIKVENKSVSLKEIKEIFANLVDPEITDGAEELNDEEIAKIINKLNNGDGISISFVGEKEVVNINISKEVAEDLTRLSKEGNSKVFNLNFSIVHDNYKPTETQGDKVVPSEYRAPVLVSDNKEIKYTSKPSLKIYSYQKNDDQTNEKLIDLTKLPGKPEEMYTSTKSVNNTIVFEDAQNFNIKEAQTKLAAEVKSENIKNNPKPNVVETVTSNSKTEKVAPEPSVAKDKPVIENEVKVKAEINSNNPEIIKSEKAELKASVVSENVKVDTKETKPEIENKIKADAKVANPENEIKAATVSKEAAKTEAIKNEIPKTVNEVKVNKEIETNTNQFTAKTEPQTVSVKSNPEEIKIVKDAKPELEQKQSEKQASNNVKVEYKEVAEVKQNSNKTVEVPVKEKPEVTTENKNIAYKRKLSELKNFVEEKVSPKEEVKIKVETHTPVTKEEKTIVENKAAETTFKKEVVENTVSTKDAEAKKVEVKQAETAIPKSNINVKETAEANSKNVYEPKVEAKKAEVSSTNEKPELVKQAPVGGNEKPEVPKATITNNKETVRTAEQFIAEVKETKHAKVENPESEKANTKTTKENVTQNFVKEVEAKPTVKHETTQATKIETDVKTEAKPENVKVATGSNESVKVDEKNTTDTKPQVEFANNKENTVSKELPKNNVNEVAKKEAPELVVEDSKEVKIKSKNAVKNISTIKEEETVKVDIKENIKAKDTVENNSKTELNTKAESVKTEFSSQSGMNQQNENSKQSFEGFNNTQVNNVNNAEKTSFEMPQNQPADRIIKSTEVLKEISNFIQKGQKTSIEFQVEPEQLGKLKIMLDVSEQAVKANIRVETEAIKYLVESNISELQNHLSRSGIQLGSVNISLSDNSPKDPKNFASKKRNQEEVKNQKEINSEEEKKEARMLGYNTVEYLA